MQIPDAIIDQIVEAASEYERRLREGSAVTLEDYAASFPSEYIDEVLRWLVPAAIAHTWDLQRASATPPMLRVQDYFAQFPMLSDATRLDLVESEFRIRQESGDRPPISQYVKEFQTLGDHLLQRLRASLMELAPTFVIHQAHPPVGLCAPIEIGRQIGTDEPDKGCVRTPAGLRLIVAPRNERRVSRRHATIELLAAGAVQVTRHQEKSVVAIGQGIEVLAGAPWIGSPPFLVHVGPATVSVESP